MRKTQDFLDGFNCGGQGADGWVKVMSVVQYMDLLSSVKAKG